MNADIEKGIKKIFNTFGFEITRKWNSPTGDMPSFLSDLKKRGFQCNAVLDVGAYKGWFSHLAAEVFPNAAFYLFEPLIEMQEELGAFCIEYPKANYFSIALGPADETLSLRTFRDLKWSGFMDVDIPAKDERTPRIVEVRKIDTLLKENKIQLPNLVKIDVQGYELEVLKGAESLFGKTELFILETSLHNKHPSFPLFADVVAFMNTRDYVVFDFPGFLRQPDSSLIECDVCFVKRNSFLRK